MKTHSLLWIVPAVMSLIALAPLPYGYYMLLRVVVCAASGILTFAEYRAGGTSAWFFALLVLALLFNPFVPVHLDRTLWSALNIVTSGLLAGHWVKRRRIARL